jgi:hypothetical protein
VPVVTSLLLAPISLVAFLIWIGADAKQALLDAAVFALTGVLAWYAARRAQVRYAALLAGLSSLVAWLLLWSKILGNPSADAYRWLLVAAAALLAVVAAALAHRRDDDAGEVVTVAGVSAVTAGTLGVIVGLAAGAINGLTGSLYPIFHHGAHPAGSQGPTSGLQHFGWDVYLLAVSLGLIWTGSRLNVRGTGYVGAFGLLAFITSVSAQVTRLEVGRTPTSHLVGWPLALLILGALGLIAPLVSRRASSRASS